MTKVNSTARHRPRKAVRPKKPAKDFPLFLRTVGQWAKKIKGNRARTAVDRHSARGLREAPHPLGGEVGRGTACDGDQPVANRFPFFAYKNGIIDRSMRYGEGFRRPSKKVMRLNKAARGSKMFEADELRRMIEATTQPMKSMLLLAINAGMGNNDVAQMPLSAMDLERGWLNYPRPKTGIMRRCPLWAETVAAIREWLAERPTAKVETEVGLVFLTMRGSGWGSDIADRPISHACRKLLDKLGINGNRNFYAARHSFETIAGDSRDQVAVDAILGHDDGSMASVYRERISDERLLTVSKHVRCWLFGSDVER